MALLGYSVMKEKILDGSKTQTIRKLRKRPIKVGEKLYHYWHLRQKDCEKLKESICSDTFNVLFKMYGLTVIIFSRDGKSNRFMNAEEKKELAIRDGFDNLTELFSWLHKKYPNFELDTFQVIRW